MRAASPIAAAFSDEAMVAKLFDTLGPRYADAAAAATRAC